MSDATPELAAMPQLPTTAGGLLRQARQAQGLHIAALAAAIKVAPRKLELLESDQFEQLADVTFTRALAQTVCRTLKIDATPILALMPPPRSVRLDQVSEGLNTPFRERPGRLVPKEWASATTPALVLAGLLLIAAVLIYVVPNEWTPFARGALSRIFGGTTAAAPTTVTEVVPPQQTASSASAPTPSPPGAVVADLMPPAVGEPAEPTPVIVATGVLQLLPSEASWVEVIDARGKSLIARLVQPGESVGLDGVMPFKVKIGNANATEVLFRGQPLDLGPFTRDNMAKLELK